MVEKEKTVPYIVYESEMARNERHVWRMWVLCLIIFALFVITNVYWVYNEMQYEEIRVDQDVTSDESDSVNVNGVETGDNYYYGGENKANHKNKAKENGR